MTKMEFSGTPNFDEYARFGSCGFSKAKTAWFGSSLTYGTMRARPVPSKFNRAAKHAVYKSPQRGKHSGIGYHISLAIVRRNCKSPTREVLVRLPSPLR